MGIDAGFDMVPRLTKGPVDSRNWQSLISAIREYYKDDENVKFKPNYVEFTVAEHPQLPLQGHKF